MTRATVCRVLAHFTHHEPEDQLPWPWIATLVVALMTTWRQGADALHAEERDLEGPLPDFLEAMHSHPDRVRRVPGVAVFPHPNATTTPLALRTNVAFNRVVHEHVVLVQIVNENVPHIRHVDRVVVQRVRQG